MAKFLIEKYSKKLEEENNPQLSLLPSDRSVSVNSSPVDNDFDAAILNLVETLKNEPKLT
jgi:hypothetical protein